MSPVSRTLRAAIAALALSLLALLPISAAAMAASPPHIAIGVTIANAPGNLAPLRAYDQATHRRPAIVMWYQNWSEPLYYSSQMVNISRTGATPMVTWIPAVGTTPISFQQIASGRYDRYIKQAADAAVAWGKPIYIRFGHEMNVSSSPYGPQTRGETPARFVAAWRHIVTIFRRDKASKVEWVWSPNVNCGGRCPFSAYYPGNSWVDWVALDGYNYASEDHMPWMSFGQIFGPSYRILTHLSNKPVMIAEIGSVGSARAKSRWISQTFLRDLPSYRRIHAAVWFDQTRSLRVDSSRASLLSWRHVVTSGSYAHGASILRTMSPFSSDIDRWLG